MGWGIMIDDIVDKYLNEEKPEEIQWQPLFDRFGGFKQFLKATGLSREAVKMYVSTGEPPERARKKIRAAVAKDIIDKLKAKKGVNEDNVRPSSTLTVKGNELYVDGKHFKVSNLSKGEKIDYISAEGNMVTKKGHKIIFWDAEDIKGTSYGR